jgi:ABC-type uncharacterized transport system involved in gliding motility auxiliary subunit
VRALVLLYGWDVLTWVFLGIGLVLGALFILSDPDQIRATLTKRGTLYGLNATLMSIAFIVILGGVNWGIQQYLDARLDVTEFKTHTLSKQSIQVMEGLDKPITIIGFFTADDYGQKDTYQELIDQYQAHSELLQYHIIDPDRDPTIARRYEEPYSGLLIKTGGIEALEGERIERVYSAREQDITGAILKITSDKPRVVYFLKGHGERDIESYAEEGYSYAAENLRAQNYEVRTLALAITTTVPSDATVVVIAGPQGKFLDEELTVLQAYLASGGRVLIMQDALSESNLNVILANWQVKFSDGLVVDRTQYYQYPTYPFSFRYSNTNPISKNLLDSRLPTIFPIASGIEHPETAATDVTFTSLVETSDDSWIEMDLESETIEQNETDIAGPVTLAAAIEKTQQNMRIVLVGDVDFASNMLNEVSGNEQLFINAINWLAEEEQLIAIGPKDSGQHAIVIGEMGKNLIHFISILLIPLMVALGGLSMWAYRKWGRKIIVTSPGEVE